MTNEVIMLCDLCREPLADEEAVQLWRWVMHPRCKEVAMGRLARFFDWIVSDEAATEIGLDLRGDVRPAAGCVRGERQCIREQQNKQTY